MIKAVSVAGLETEGTPFKKPSVQLDEAARTISLGHLTWIECVVDNILEETPNILTNLGDRKSTRLNSSHSRASRMPSSA